MQSRDKQDKKSVNYRIGEPNKRCGICMNYRVPSVCTRVEGHIEPDDLCDLFNSTFLTVDEE